MKKSHAIIPAAWLCKNVVHDSEFRRYNAERGERYFTLSYELTAVSHQALRAELGEKAELAELAEKRK